MKHEKKFESQEQQQTSEAQSQQTIIREFTSVEEVLRFDAKRTEVPPEIAQRLGRTLRDEPRPARSWWRHWFGKQK
jgi:hypothetical protein